MHNEVELTIKHFDKKEIATRRDLWDKIEQLKSELEVYKRALELADLETEGMKDWLLHKARKELEDD